MAMIHSDTFKRDAVRIATTSGLTVARQSIRRIDERGGRQVAADLGGGLWTLNKWVKMVSDEA